MYIRRRHWDGDHKMMPKPLVSCLIVIKLVLSIVTRFENILKVRGVKLCSLYITGKIHGNSCEMGKVAVTQWHRAEFARHQPSVSLMHQESTCLGHTLQRSSLTGLHEIISSPLKWRQIIVGARFDATFCYDLLS